jgi:hypothetical protein
MQSEIFENKDSEELSVVQEIFSKDTHTIIGLTRPDFKIIRKSDFLCTGVEVTELYYHVASAKLKKFEGYVDQVLEGKMNFQDQDILHPDSIILPERLDAKGNPLELKAVIYNNPNIQGFLNILQNLIVRKSNKYLYKGFPNRSLELVIVDMENFFHTWELTAIAKPLFFKFNRFFPGLVFDEVYLLGGMAGERMYVPLHELCVSYRNHLSIILASGRLDFSMPNLPFYPVHLI